MKRKALALPEYLYSPDQLVAVAGELESYATVLGQATRSKKAGELPELSAAAAAALELIPAAERNTESSVDELRQRLEALAAEAPRVTVVLAALASSKLKQEFVAWFRKNVRPDILVTFRANPDIAGGIVVRGMSRVYDDSFRTALLAHPENLVKGFDGVR